ncbi:hypothetical Protein YC6258_05679 [Gynuella sunshinyii YC6258]|uniref:Uncharacterized protein n=1 Tax=Gynuella sunshinyii YC6258 TaxID=1445510 RepID=A0A0C5VSQ4_9GAMM|nr:hypothetical Protein YC6258_05679 [Gynuella sunshinyii YC6258]
MSVTQVIIQALLFLFLFLKVLAMVDDSHTEQQRYIGLFPDR